MAERIANPAAIEELEQDVSSLNSKITNIPIELGLVTTFTVSNRKVYNIYHMLFDQNTSGTPFGTGSGHGYLFVGNHINYGRLILFSNSGIKTATLSEGSYGAFATIV